MRTISLLLIGLVLGGRTAAAADPADLYPYVVPAGYLRYQKPEPPEHTYPLGHGLHVTLVFEADGAARNASSEELAALGLDARAAHAKAMENLAERAEGGEIEGTAFEGPEGKLFVVYRGHWLAASMLLLPNIGKPIEHSGFGEACASVPHRDALLVFPCGDAPYRKEMRRIIEEKESGAGKPLSFEFFRFTPEGPKPLD